MPARGTLSKKRDAPPATAPPYAVAFQFRNDTAAPVFPAAELRQLRLRPPCDLAAAISFSNVGGLAPSQDSEMLTPPAIDRRTRSTFGTGASIQSCAPKIPRCSRDAPGVATSFGIDGPAFGVDPRVADGSILVVSRPNGTSVGLGSTCSQGCARPLSPALQTLGSVLQSLSAQQLGDAACAALAQPQ